MEEAEFNAELASAESIADIFELVKEVVYDLTEEEQAGIMVGLSDLGKTPKGFVGAYYSSHSNMIILNKRIMEQIKWQTPELIKPYLFHLLLHEYIHSIGVYDELQTRELTNKIAQRIGDETIIKMSENLTKHFPEIVHTEKIEVPNDQNIYFVKGIDRKNMNYIY